MAESIEVLREQYAGNPFLYSTNEAIRDGSRLLYVNFGGHAELGSAERVPYSGFINWDSNQEFKKKKKKKKSRSLHDNTVIAYTEIKKPPEMQGPRRELKEKIPMIHRQNFLLQHHRIEPKKPTPKIPRGRFYCTLCNYFCDSWYILETHVATSIHLNALEDSIDHESIKLIPPPLPEQINVITELLRKNNSKNGISKLDERQAILVRFQELVEISVSGCTVKLFGSSEYKAGLTNSNVNLNVTIPTSQDRPTTMLAVHKQMKNDVENIRNVNFNMSQDVPSITFVDIATNLECCLSFNNSSACDVAHLLRTYLSLDERALELASALRFWGFLCGLDKMDSGTLPAHAFPIIVIYYLQQLRNPVLPVLNDQEICEEESVNPEDLGKNGFKKKKWQSKNKMSIGELWLGLFKFYLVEFDVYEKVISIKTKDPVPQSSKRWSSRRLSIEDPVAPHRNIAKSFINSKTLRYFMSCLRTTFLYFATPQMISGPIFRRVQMLPPGMTDMTNLLMERENFLNFLCRFHPSFLNEQQIKQINKTDMIGPGDPNYDSISKFIVTPDQARYLFKKVNPAYLLYNFSRKYFTGEKPFPLVCVYCREEGHYKDKCPEESLPPLEKLPYLPKSYMKKLSVMCEALYESWALTPSDIAERENIVFQLLLFLRQKFPDVELTLFGSTCNGFGLKRSDVDICFTFTSCPSTEDLDYTKLIQDLYGLLKKYSAFSNLVPITTAKVPILKFNHCETKLDGDISFHNTLALRNTKMLQTYSRIDVRAKVLGYVVKRFAKICNICDASKGSLSSYAYILMMIHFLQQCNPPVLPVLQEIEKPPSIEDYIVEGCDTYFFEDLEKLPYCWEEYGKNDKTVGELWIEFLCFYTEVYKFAECIISIRTKNQVTRFEKVWHSKSMAIEDPFDHSHNLGNGLNPKMHQFILKALRNGRSFFTCQQNLPNSHPLSKSSEKYFEASKVKGSPPDRGCHNCKKIGHIAKDCPARLQKRENSSESKDHQRDRFAQSTKSPKRQNNLKKNNAMISPPFTVTHPELEVGSWEEGAAAWEKSLQNFGNEKLGNTKANVNNDGRIWQEQSNPWVDQSDQKVGSFNPPRNEKVRKSTWWNKSIPNAIPVTPLVSTPNWNIRPIPLQNAHVPPEIQAQLQALAKKWHIGPEYKEISQPTESKVIMMEGSSQSPQRYLGEVVNVYTRPSEISDLSCAELNNNTPHYPSNFQG